MRPGLSIALALACVAMAQVDESFGGNIVLGRPTDRSVAVNALFTADHDMVYVEYGEKSGALDKQTAPRQSIRARIPYQETISGLEPNRRYYYRLRYRKSAQDTLQASAEHRFHTQRARGETFTFTIVADSHLFTPQHCNPDRYAHALANAVADNPDFHIDLGDTFRSDTIVRNQADLTYQQVLDRAIAHRPYFGIVTADAPLFLVNGNHDSEYLYYAQAGSGQNPRLPQWALDARLALFSNPTPDGFYTVGPRQSYYAWEWGDALFVVLDPYWLMGQRTANDWSPVHGDAQYAWFRDTLRNSKAKYKFVFEHHVLGQGRGGVEMASQYEWGGQDTRRTQSFQQARPGWDKPMHQLMVETGVTIYFQGHDHLFAKAVLDGVTYVTVPMPGAGPPGAVDYFPGNESAGNFDAYLRSFTLPNSGHLRVSVSPTGVNVGYVVVRLPRDPGTNRDVAYSFMAGSTPPQLTVVSAASYRGVAIAPGSIATAFGHGPLAGAAVTVADSAGAIRTAHVLASADKQVSFVVPEEAATGDAVVTVSRNGATLASGIIAIQALEPALFSANASGFGVAAASAVLVRSDGTQVSQPVFECRPNAVCTSVPLDPGGPNDQLILTLYGTGIGRVQASEVFVHAGNARAEVLYAGPQGDYPGLDQINIRVPRAATASGESGVVLAISGKTANVVTVNLK